MRESRRVLSMASAFGFLENAFCRNVLKPFYRQTGWVGVGRSRRQHAAVHVTCWSRAEPRRSWRLGRGEGVRAAPPLARDWFVPRSGHARATLGTRSGAGPSRPQPERAPAGQLLAGCWSGRTYFCARRALAVFAVAALSPLRFPFASLTKMDPDQNQPRKRRVRNKSVSTIGCDSQCESAE